MSEEEQRRRRIDGPIELRKLALLEAKVNAICQSLTALVEHLDDIHNSWNNMSAKEQTMLNIPPEELDRLPWTKYPSGPFGEWTLAKNARILAEALRRQPTKSLIMAGFEYRLQGTDDKFIARWPMPLRFSNKTEGAGKSER